MRILAVDDDTLILELLRETLAASGYHDAVTANSADEAMALIAAPGARFDCLLLDIQMPGRTGLDLCADIRATPGYSRTPIIMVTAMSEKSYVDRAFEAGATDYVTKPFDQMELSARLGVAGKLIDERRQVEDGMCRVHEMTEQLDASLSLSLCEPIEIKGVSRCLGYIAFENYVLHLTRGSLFFSSALAIKIANIATLHETLRASDFCRMLTAVARLMSDRLEAANAFLSYRGNGVFVCISHRLSLFERDDLRQLLVGELRSVRFRNPGGGSLPIDLVVGKTTSPGAFSKPGTLGFLRESVQDCESRAARLADSPNTAQSVDKAELMARQKQYQRLFRENLVNGMLPEKPPSACKAGEPRVA
ncbi:MAG: PleD family two-component system response regulator [Paracoccaceae bacterium]